MRCRNVLPECVAVVRPRFRQQQATSPKDGRVSFIQIKFVILSFHSKN